MSVELLPVTFIKFRPTVSETKKRQKDREKTNNPVLATKNTYINHKP